MVATRLYLRPVFIKRQSQKQWNKPGFEGNGARSQRAKVKSQNDNSKLKTFDFDSLLESPFYSTGNTGEPE
jgi:hypothetical protein